MVKSEPAQTNSSKRRDLSGRYYALERHLRELPETQEEETLTFARLEQILKDDLPLPAYEDPGWWANQKQGLRVETIPWMDAGWLVESVDLDEKWVRFVRQ